jgi:hypothetical protein
MSSSNSKKRKSISYKDRINSNDLISLSDVRLLYKNYNHNQLEKFEKNLTLHDVGCIFYLIYLKRKYNSCEININEDEICKIDLPSNQNILEWLEELDFYVDDERHPKFLIYFKNKEFIYDPNLIKSNSDKLQIHLVSHTFPIKDNKSEGHIGALIIQNGKCYYFDSNGMKDDDLDYYDCFIRKLTQEMMKYNLEYIPYQWKRGLQIYQESENDRYKVDMLGMCCSWSFFILELKLLNPLLTIEQIEIAIRKKYKNRLTRMISTYQQEIHNTLWKIAKEIYFSIE